MADDDKQQRAKDLLRSGALDEREPGSSAFGDRVMRRHLRRPAGNSERLWRKVDGTDPWDLPEPPRPEKQRGVWAAGRFVRMNEAEQKKAKSDSHIPDWARKQAEQPRKPKAEEKPEPKQDPTEKIKEVIARRQAQADAEARKAAAEREPVAPPPEAPEATHTPDERAQPIGSRQATVTRGGRIRTQHGGAFEPSAARAARPDPEDAVQHRYAAGRAPPPPRKKPKDLSLEDRRPPRVDPNKPAEVIDPRSRRYAAGRAPPPPRQKPTDLSLEDRRPPRFDPNAPPVEQAPVEHRYAAGRAPPPPRQQPTDLPIEMRHPSKVGAGSQQADVADEPQDPTVASAPEAPAPQAPPDRTPPRPAGPSKPPGPPVTGGNSASLDDLFGLAANEGRVRIGRRTKKTAAAEPSDDQAEKGD